MGDIYDPLGESTDPQVPENPGTIPEATFSGGYSETPQSNGTILRCEIWNLPGGGTERRNCTTVAAPTGSPTTPTAPTTPGETPAAPAPAPPAELTPEQQEALAHDTNPDQENTVDYEPVYDAEGRVTGYNMYVDGYLKQTFDYSHLYQALDDIEKPGTFQSYLDENGYEITDPTQSAEYLALTELIQKMQDPNTTAEDMQAGTEQAALAMGYGSTQEYLDAIASKRGQLEGGIGNMQGLTDAEIAAQQAATRSTIELQQNTFNRTLDAILSGSTGNSTRNALLKARDFTMQIRDTQMQADCNLALMDYQRKKDEFDGQLNMYKDMLDRGQLTREQFMASVAQNRSMALQGYATQINTILQTNQQYLQMYSADLDRIRLASDQVYATVQAELNIGADQREAISESFNQYWAEIMAPLNYEKAQLEVAELENEQRSRTTRTVLGVLAMIAGVCLLFVPGVGAAAGGTLIATGAGMMA
ncbi:MAG: hypothetical protein WC455_13620 [Dehalococcoidia bacterium]|jgi:hypothetical protein